MKQKYEWSGSDQVGANLRAFQIQHDAINGWSIANITAQPNEFIGIDDCGKILRKLKIIYLQILI